MFDLRNNFPVQIILVDLSMDSVHLDRNRGKTTNWMRRVNGTKLPISIVVDPIIRRPANLETWAQKLDIFFRQFNAPQHPSIHFASNENGATAFHLPARQSASARQRDFRVTGLVRFWITKISGPGCFSQDAAPKSQVRNKQRTVPRAAVPTAVSDSIVKGLSDPP